MHLPVTQETTYNYCFPCIPSLETNVYEKQVAQWTPQSGKPPGKRTKDLDLINKKHNTGC
jgi:hypothetical protein